MKRAALFFLATGLAPLLAQTAKPKAAPVDAATAFAIAEPDETSPFFVDSQSAALARNADYAGRDANDAIAGYPQNRNSSGSALAQIKGFFGGMFSSVNFGPMRTPPTTENLAVEPAKFSLQDRRELSVTYTIRNNTKNISRLEYPTTQRIDILTYDPKGNIVDRWSDDRAFVPEEGIVVINPKERIEYQEKIPTREMKPGESYRVESFTTSTEKFQSAQTITPE
ncbi:MAG: BsuPI-related putative proteinase inhibitor [Terrimicrobiaceae bacterium]